MERHRPARKIMLLSTLIFMIILSSCSKKAVFLTSSVVPAARGSVTYKTDKNDNYVIKIKVFNLAEVDRLQSGNAYVVWMESADNNIKNIGQIKSQSGFMSKKLEATFETVSSVKPTRIIITAENNAEAQYPSDAVLSTDKF